MTLIFHKCLSLFYINMYLVFHNRRFTRTLIQNIFPILPTPHSTLNVNTPHLHTPLNHNPSVPICVIDNFLACQSGTGKDIVLQSRTVAHRSPWRPRVPNKGRACSVHVILTRLPQTPSAFHLRLLITDMPPQTERDSESDDSLVTVMTVLRQSTFNHQV